MSVKILKPQDLITGYHNAAFNAKDLYILKGHFS